MDNSRNIPEYYQESTELSANQSNNTLQSLAQEYKLAVVKDTACACLAKHAISNTSALGMQAKVASLQDPRNADLYDGYVKAYGIRSVCSILDFGSGGKK